MSRQIYYTTQTTSGIQICTGGATREESLMLARKAKAKTLCMGGGFFSFFNRLMRDSVEDLKQIYKKNGGGCFAIAEIFGEKASFEIAYGRIEARSRKNPGGASSKTVNALWIAQIQPQSSRTQKL